MANGEPEGYFFYSRGGWKKHSTSIEEYQKIECCKCQTVSTVLFIPPAPTYWTCTACDQYQVTEQIEKECRKGEFPTVRERGDKGAQ